MNSDVFILTLQWNIYDDKKLYRKLFLHNFEMSEEILWKSLPTVWSIMCEMCKNWGFCWSVFSCIRTYSWILSLYGKIQVSENPYFCLYYAVLCNRSVHVFLQKCIQNPMKHLSCYCTKNEVFHSGFLWWWYVGGTVWRHRLFLNVLFRQ